jgi:hypothetical protein
MLMSVDIDNLQHALGGVVLEAAYLERVDSKYAAVVDGRLTAAALIEDCERITRYRADIPEAAKEAGPKAIPYKHLSAGSLTAAISDAVNRGSYHTRAQEIAKQLASEDGTLPVIRALDHLTA